MKAIVLSSAAQAWTSIIEWSGIAGFLMVEPGRYRTGHRKLKAIDRIKFVYTLCC